MKKIIFIALLIYSFTPYAQETITKAVWDLEPEFSVINPEHDAENVVGIFYKERREFYYGDDDRLALIHTIHKKFRLNNDESINGFNKISVSMSRVIELIEIKARVIKPDGKVVTLDEDNIKEVKDEEVEKGITLFAIDGIEKGDDVEYYIMLKKTASNFGRVYYQFSYPLLEGSLEVIAPENLFYDIKGYNGFPNAIHSKMTNNNNHYLAELKDIPSIKQEKFAFLTPRKARVEYRLDINKYIGPSQRLTWDDAAQQIYSVIYEDVNQKKLSKWLKLIKVKDGTDLERASQVEDFLKQNIFIQEEFIPEFDDIGFMLKNRVTSPRGMTRLYANIFESLGIKHNVVLTSERDNVKFDKDFQSWNYLSDYLIYIPDGDKYIDPSDNTLRIGYVNGLLTATDALFVKVVKIGDYVSAVAKLKYIEPLEHDMNYHNMKIDISVDVDKAEANVATTIGFKGLSGGYFDVLFDMMDEENRENILLQLAPADALRADFKKLEVQTQSDIEYLKDAGFIMYSEISNQNFIEFAGNKLLLKVGETIGEQSEMYFEEDRTALVENSFNRKYYREITLKVPEGYKISNPEVCNINFKENIDDKDAFGFVSSYTYEGDIYKIIIEEYYKNIFVNFDHFDGYKDVVNAAADFNKIVLILETK